MGIGSKIIQHLFYAHPLYYTPVESKVSPHSVDFPPRTKHPTLLIFSYIVDLFTLIVFGVFIYVFTILPAPEHLFRLDDTSLMYPIPQETINFNLSGFLNIGLPFIILLLIQPIFIRNIWDTFHAIFTLADTIAVNMIITSFLWWSVGGLRPYTITACQPDPARIIPGKIYYRASEICTSSYFFGQFETPAFPSGHSSNSFAGWVFLAIYFSARLKVYDGYSHLYKLFFLFAPFYFAVWQAYTRVIDGIHTREQIYFGAFIGITSALLVYRLNYCSLFGHDNHIPTRYMWNINTILFKRNKNLKEKQVEKQTQNDIANNTHVIENKGSGVENLTAGAVTSDNIASTEAMVPVDGTYVPMHNPLQHEIVNNPSIDTNPIQNTTTTNDTSLPMVESIGPQV